MVLHKSLPFFSSFCSFCRVAQTAGNARPGERGTLFAPHFAGASNTRPKQAPPLSAMSTTAIGLPLRRR